MVVVIDNGRTDFNTFGTSGDDRFLLLFLNDMSVLSYSQVVSIFIIVGNYRLYCVSS